MAPQLAAALSAGDSEFQRLIEKLPAGAYTCDLNGLITFYNRHAVDLWGRAPKLNDVADRYCGSFRLFSSADGSPVRHECCWMARALQTGAEYNGEEIVIERPDGQRRTVLAYAHPIHAETGEMRGAVNVLVDITDRRRTEEALRQADRSKNEFLATLSHELRNPLAPLRNAVQVLRMQAQSSPDAQWATDVIERQMRHMTRLIDDLLDVSRIERNKLELLKERVDLASALRLAVETSRPLIDASGHDFEIDLPSEPMWLHADLTRLAQAISNLLNNAAKYTDRGGRLWLKARHQGNDAVVTVRDTGVGISPEMLGRVFDMFTQGDRSRGGSQGGLGIGLTLVKRLIELHGGSIEAHSEGENKGSHFVVRLPMIADTLQEPAAAPPSLRPREAPRPAGRRILVVDDNRDSADSLGMLLRLTGNDVRTAYDGQAAIDAARDFLPAVALLDIGMPNLNGYDAARAMRNQSWGKHMTLIALTGWGQDGDKERSRDAGFDHHMVKPVEPKALLELLASLETAPQGA